MNITEHMQRLPLFAEVVKRGSIRKGAQQLRLSQPAVSRTIRLLEEAIGAPVLERSKYGVHPTEVGKKLLAITNNFLENIHELEGYFEQLETEAPRLRIGTYDSVAIYFFPEFIRLLQKHFPNTEIEIECDRSLRLAKRVDDGEIDFAICSDGFHSKKVKSVHLYDDFYQLYIGARPVPLARMTFVTLADATDSKGKTLESHLKDFFGSRLALIRAPSFEVARALTVSGLAIGALPTRVAKCSSKGLSLFEYGPQQGPLKPFGQHSFYLRASHTLSKKRAVLNKILNILGDVMDLQRPPRVNN